MHEQEAWELGSVLSRDLVRGFQSASWRPVAACLSLERIAILVFLSRIDRYCGSFKHFVCCDGDDRIRYTSSCIVGEHFESFTLRVEESEQQARS